MFPILRFGSPLDSVTGTPCGPAGSWARSMWLGNLRSSRVSVGEGSLVLFGFQPNYRAQTVATWPMLFNALTPSVRIAAFGWIWGMMDEVPELWHGRGGRAVLLELWRNGIGEAEVPGMRTSTSRRARFCNQCGSAMGAPRSGHGRFGKSGGVVDGRCSFVGARSW